MVQWNRIYVAVPPTELAGGVVGRGAMLARAAGAGLRLAACVYDPYLAGERFSDSPELEESRTDLVNERRKALEAMAVPLREEGIEVSVDAFWGYPVHTALVDNATDWSADLIVAGTWHHSLPQRIGLTNTDWHMIRECPIPLLLARARMPADKYMRVLASVDPMHAHDKPATLDARLLDTAGEVAALFGGTVYLVHAYFSAQYVPMLAPGAGMTASFYARESPEASHRAALDRLIEGRDVARERVHLLEGDARNVIPDFVADNDVDLVVMGAVSRSRIREFLIGSTAETVLDALTCDALILKPSAPE